MLCFKNNRQNKVCKIDILFGYCQRSSFFLSSRSVVTLISERREVLLGFEWLSFKKLICVPFCLFQDAAPHFKLSKPTKWHRQVLVGHHQESLHFVDSLLVSCVWRLLFYTKIKMKCSKTCMEYFWFTFWSLFLSVPSKLDNKVRLEILVESILKLK